jgi:hypothetical protein
MAEGDINGGVLGGKAEGDTSGMGASGGIAESCVKEAAWYPANQLSYPY